jgi:cellulose synthase/poly-beta-1,6-N-acetylglucosamine synthase-like glycosyltransferase
MQLPIFNEVYVVERLLKAVSEIDYPREKLQIQVLDDSTDDTKELTQRCVAELQGRGLER